MIFNVKKIVLALAIAGYAASSSYAALTSPTGSIQGTAPVLEAPSNGAAHAVDFTTNATGTSLATGNTVTMTYTYLDSDGDLDASNTHVTWYYVKGGVDTAISSSLVTSTAAATVGGSGTSVLTIPAAAVGATAIKVEIQEYSASGDPISGNTISVADISNGVGGGTTTPPGPIVPGTSGMTAGIYASTDSTFSNNLIGSATKLTVGSTYVFKLFDDSDGSDLTSSVSYNWRLMGTSAVDNISAPANGFVTSVSNGNFTVPVNTAPNGKALTGSNSGAQGFSLAVDYN